MKPTWTIDTSVILEKKSTTSQTLDNQSVDNRFYESIKGQGERPQEVPTPSPKTVKGKIIEAVRVVGKVVKKVSKDID